MCDGKPCPNCTKDQYKIVPIVYGVPSQYQGVAFDKSFLPEHMQEKYGTFMESLLNEITTGIMTFQKNMLIAARPNCGKTIWFYNLYSKLQSKGYNIPLLRDVLEIRDMMQSPTKENMEYMENFNKARIAICKVSQDSPPWVIDIIQSIVSRRVRNNGCTIFLFDGDFYEFEKKCQISKVISLKGSGAYNTLYIQQFYERSHKDEA